MVQFARFSQQMTNPKILRQKQLEIPQKAKKSLWLSKAAGNAFFEIAAKSFQETVEAEGGEVQVVYPETATADAQIKVLDNLISQDFDAICISANDVNALQAKLEEAMDEESKYLPSTPLRTKTAVRFS